MVLLPQGLWLSFLRVYVVESLEILQLQYQRESTTTTILNLILILCVMCLRRFSLPTILIKSPLIFPATFTTV